MQNMDLSWIPNGFDPETAFRIEVKIEAYWNKQNLSSKDYVKGKILKKVVDSDRFSLCDFLSDLAEEITWGSCQTPKIWLFDKNENKNVGLLTESQIPHMFEMYKKERKITFLVVMCDSDGSSKCSGTNATNPCTLSQPSPSIALGSQVGSTQGCSISEQPDEVANRDEYVGFDDENMYGSYGDDGFVHENAMYAIQVVQSDPETNLEDNVAEEPIVEDGVDGQANVAFDPENPNIEVNALFPDVDAFRRALRHFAIKNEFEVSTVKSDKTRFIGKCKHPDCPWRIRASRLQDNKTFMIKKLPHDHTCPSTSMVDGKMASSSWVSERVGDWLRKNPSAGAKEVKSKLEDVFHVKVTYNKAWEGRRAALNQIHGKWEESFQLVYNFKAELERRCPGSIIEIDCTRVGDKVYFIQQHLL